MRFLRPWFSAPASPVRLSCCRPNLETLEDRQVLSLTYHGGILLPQVEVNTVYYGQAWQGSAQMNQLDTFLQDITHSPFMDQLAQYNVGEGALVGRDVVPTTLGSRVSDRTIRSMLSSQITQGLLPAPDANRLYFVFVAPNVVVTDQGQNSVNDFAGYHGNFTDSAGHAIAYAVIPHPVGNGDIPGLNDFQSLTDISSHELAEAVTDPFDGGWYNDATFDENGDYANGVTGTLNGYTVQYIYSNAADDNLLAPSSPPPRNTLAVGYGFVGSDEYLGRLVTQHYQDYLGRIPSAGEVAGWVQSMHSGASDDQVIANFLASAEYYQDSGGTNKAFVDSLYQKLMNRNPDAGGENYWLGALASGSSRYNVALGFVTSYEREVIVIQADYAAYLGRQASNVEVGGWLYSYQHGMSNVQIVARFIASSEYVNLHAGTVNSWLDAAYLQLLNRPPDYVGYPNFLVLAR